MLLLPMILDCVFMEEQPSTPNKYPFLEKPSINCQSTHNPSVPDLSSAPSPAGASRWPLQPIKKLRPPATPSGQLGAPRHLLLHLPLALSQTDGCAGSGHRKGRVCFGFYPDKKRGRANRPCPFLFQSTASHLVSSASGRLLRSSPHEAALTSSCTSAPGSLTSLFLVSDCQDTRGREKWWLEADLSRCKPGLFLSSPPPGEVRPFPMAQGGGKRKQAGKLTRPLQHVLRCAWFPPQETQEVREVLHQQPLRDTQEQVERLRQVSVTL